MVKKIPMRKCIITGEEKPKKELVRVVRDPDNTVFVDRSGKKNGRGAYLTDSEDIFLQAKAKDSLSRHLKVKVSSEDYDRLLEERRGASHER